jgi:two-component system chemotaxis sensor kinase CheA
VGKHTTGILVERSARFSVGTKLALATISLIALASALIYWGLLAHERAGLLDAKRKAAGMVLDIVSQALSAPIVFSDDAGVSETLHFLEDTPDVLHAVVWRTGEDGVIGEQIGEFQRTPGTAKRERPRSDALGIHQASDRELDATALVLDSEGNRVGLVSLRFSLDAENRAFALLSTRILQVSVVIALALSLLLFMLARLYIIKPIGSLYIGVRRFERGELVDIKPVANDEVGHLTEAFARMAATIDKRERAIATKNREMRLVLDNVGQGFLVLSAEGTMQGEHSAIVETWFGSSVAEQPIWEYLRPYDATNAEWLELTWSNLGVPFMPLEVCIEQLPKRFISAGRYFDFEYRPLTSAEGTLENVVVVISDVTDLVAREKAEREQRELVAIFNRMVADRVGFLGFYEDAAATVRRIAEDGHDPRQVMRDVHTLKSNAGLYQLYSISTLCEEIEGRAVDEHREISLEERESIARAWARIADAMARYLGADRERSLEVSRADYESLIHAVEQWEPHARLWERVADLGAEPGERVLGRLAERIEVLARRLGKCDVQVRMSAGRLRFPTTRFAPLWATLAHVVRNVADHGLETPSERSEANKPQPALIELSADVRGDTIVIRIADDGRGVAWEKVEARARERGLPAGTRAELVAALFHDGFSMANTNMELSGRGVGLSAVRATVEGMGGKVSFESERGRGSLIHIELPARLLRSSPPMMPLMKSS